MKPTTSRIGTQQFCNLNVVQTRLHGIIKRALDAYADSDAVKYDGNVSKDNIENFVKDAKEFVHFQEYVPEKIGKRDVPGERGKEAEYTIPAKTDIHRDKVKIIKEADFAYYTVKLRLPVDLSREKLLEA